MVILLPVTQLLGIYSKEFKTYVQTSTGMIVVWSECLCSSKIMCWNPKTQQEVYDPKKGPYQTALAPWPQTSSLHNWEQSISVVYKLPSLWYFVVAAQMD